jgi:hypothetical protein
LAGNYLQITGLSGILVFGMERQENPSGNAGYSTIKPELLVSIQKPAQFYL